MVSYSIIGAGIAGLSLALELEEAGVDARVIEYRDRVGGVNILYPGIDSFIDCARHRTNIVSAAAIRINERIYELRGNSYSELRDAVAATGFRVATLPELGVYGDRPAGVYTFHAVLDLIHYGLLPGKRIVIYGDNAYAALLSNELTKLGCMVTLVTPTKIDSNPVSDVTMIKGTINRIKGTSRVEGVRIYDKWIDADTLIVAIFKTHNPFPELRAIGQAVIESFDPNIIMESGKIMAHELIGDGEPIIIDSNIPIYPGNLIKGKTRRVIVALRGGGKIMINDKEYAIHGDAAVIDLPKTDKVCIRGVN
ncbi:MAG: monooxygenase [Thermocladium sp. ECH_B]|nr:MAG: monooxygenase [Thermocladium sp. ECH_B]